MNGPTSSDTCNTVPGPKSGYLSTKARIRITDFKEAKRRGEKWAMLTCYDCVSASIFDKAKIPCLLIGDSAAQTVLGYKSTVPVTVDELIPLCQAVSRSCERALVVADLPFGSYQESPALALKTATRFMKEAQVHAVKLEGGAMFAEHVRLLTQSGIPVMGHVGFTPQSEHALGGFKVQGRGDDGFKTLLNDVKKIQEAGAFACVLELVPSEVASRVTSEVTLPIVGIGAGPGCDAQILVWQDMAGFTPAKGSGYLNDTTSSNTLELQRVPKFVKRYANMSQVLFDATVAYQDDVISGKYPSEEHCYK